MPKPLWGHVMLRLGPNLVVIGGNDGWKNYQSSLYLLSYDMQWHTMSQKLKIPRAHFVAMAVTDELVDCS